jgi:iron complex outermembrane recepter protein
MDPSSIPFSSVPEEHLAVSVASKAVAKRQVHPAFPSNQAPARLSTIAALVAAMSILGAGAVHAQTTQPTVAELQAEIARLKQALAEKNGAPAAPEAAPVANTSAPAAAEAPKASAQAPQQLETVVVRSRNRLERVQDVPLSVSLLGGRELERELAADIGAITKRAANVVRNTGNSRTYSLSIRGVGKVSQVESQDASVGVLLDGVSYAYAPLASFDFYDVDTVEVTRGPQGTLLGKNTTMGVINVTSKKPTFTPEANWSLTLGKNNTVISQFSGGGPVIDDLLAFRGSVTVNKGNGPFKNAYNSDQGYFNRDRVAGRIQFLLTPSPDFSARASVDFQPKAGEFYNGLTVKTQVPSTYATGVTTNNTQLDIRNKLSRSWFNKQTAYSYEKDYLGKGFPNNDAQLALQTETKGASLDLKWNLGSHDLTSITAYRDYHFHARNDEGTPFDISKNGGGKVDLYKQFSQELRLTSKPGGLVDYQVGALFFKNPVAWNSGWGADAGAWFASNSQYTTLNADAIGRELLSDSLNGLNRAETQSIRNTSYAVYGQADWHLNEKTNLTTGIRFTHEVRDNRASRVIANNGYGGLLNASKIGNVTLGGFDSYHQRTSSTKDVWIKNGAEVAANTPGATFFAKGVDAVALTTDTTDAAAVARATAAADAAAVKYFGAGKTWATLTGAQQKQLAAAQALRRSQMGALYALVDADTFRKTQPSFVISPSYKINDDHTAYTSLQYGEKGGSVQVVDGVSFTAKPEKVTSLEVGLKSSYFNKTLQLNTAAYVTRVKDYQQAVTFIDPTSGSSVNYTGNAPKVGLHGLEIDANYTGLRNTTVRVSGAISSATFKEFKNSPNPAELAYSDNPSKFLDVTGQTLTGAAKYTFNIGAEYRLPVFTDKVFHTSINTAYTSSYNSDNALSSYGWIPGNAKTDFSIGLGRRDNGFDTTLVVKNLLNDKTPQSRTWNTYVPADPRWFGIQFSGKL